MTSFQKEHISNMRRVGESYSAIAEALGLSRNTIKSYCQRKLCEKPYSDDEHTLAYSNCDQCGMKFTLYTGHRQRRFCSDRCRVTWWNAHRDLLNSKGLLEHTCVCCGKRFMGYEWQHRKYCSHACYIADRYGKERHLHE